MGGQYVTVATEVAIVGWLFRESAGRLACTERSFTMIVTLSTYLLSLRLSGVLEVDTSVGRRCSTMSGLVLSVAFVGLGSGDGEQTYPGLWFLPVWHGGIPDSVLLLVVLFVPVEPPLVVEFLCVCGFGCQGFPCFP